MINTCAFTNASQDAEENVFKIAVKTLTKLIESDYMEPSSSTFGWFIQACERLKIPTEIKESNLERAFHTCCEKGLVNDFVLSRLKVAASDVHFKQLVSPAVRKLRKCDKDRNDLKQQINLSHLPMSWTSKHRNARRARKESEEYVRPKSFSK